MKMKLVSKLTDNLRLFKLLKCKSENEDLAKPFELRNRFADEE
jgi:hypothetical protein